MIFENLKLTIESQKQKLVLIASFIILLTLLLFTSNAISFPDFKINPFIELANLVSVSVIAFLISVNLVVLIYKNNLKKLNKEKATGIFGVFASLFASSCSVCQPAIFAWFGLGSVTGFFADLSIYFSLLSTVFLIISLYLNLKSINGKCEVK